MIRKSKNRKKTTRPSKFKGMLRYKKIRGGVHKHHNGQTVRKGEILYANDGELSKIIMKGFVCLDEQIQEATKGITLGLKDRGNGWYDVINKQTGERLNDDHMRAKDARQFITGEIDDNLVEDNVDDDDNLDPDDDTNNDDFIGSNDLEEIVEGTKKLEDLKLLVHENDEFEELREEVDEYAGINGMNQLRIAMLDLLEDDEDEE